MERLIEDYLSLYFINLEVKKSSQQDGLNISKKIISFDEIQFICKLITLTLHLYM